MVDFFYIALGAATIGGLYYVYETYRRNKLKKDLGKLIKILLFENIGNDKIFKGNYRGEEVEDPVLGVYIWINKVKKPISDVDPKDFFIDIDSGKCLLVCKYSDDDYRSMARLTNGDYYKKVMKDPEDYYETEELENPESKELEIVIKTDDNGDPIIKKDSYGKSITPYDYISVDEPIGVTQQAREALRFSRDFARRMAEKRKEKSGFWEKYGVWIMTAGMFIVILIAVGYNTNKMSETMKYMTDKFDENSKNAISQMNNPSWVEGLVDKINNRNVEDNQPPPP